MIGRPVDATGMLENLQQIEEALISHQVEMSVEAIRGYLAGYPYGFIQGYDKCTEDVEAQKAEGAQ